MVRTEPSWLDTRLPCWRTPRTEPGLLAVVDPTADISWAEQTLAGDDTELLVWTSAGTGTRTGLERAGLQTAQRHGVRAVSLAPTSRELRRLRAAIQLADRLGDSRGDHAVSARAHLTGAAAPATVDQSVRIPHLLTLSYRSGHLGDTVIWELIPRIAAPEWSRVPPATRSFVEVHLPRLLALRTAARTGTLPPTIAGRRLADLLASKPLSIRVVYRHLDLIRPLLAGTVTAASQQADPVTGADSRAGQP
jgi:hypothetical protein